MPGARFVPNQFITMTLIVNAVHCITTSIACVKRIPECKNGWSYPLVRVALNCLFVNYQIKTYSSDRFPTPETPEKLIFSGYWTKQMLDEWSIQREASNGARG
jgi:hypothetical protein